MHDRREHSRLQRRRRRPLERTPARRLEPSSHHPLELDLRRFTTGGGGVQSGGNTTLINCVIAQNSPNGVQIQGDNNKIQDCTFNGNSGYGAAFLVSNSNTITNSIFWGDLVPELFFDGSSSASITYCDVQGGSPFAGSGNIQADPLFLGAPADLRLGPASPAVDAGNNTLVPGGTTIDVRGLPRFFDDPDVPDTGIGNVPPGIVDMGAYERIPITVTDAERHHTSAPVRPAVFSVTATGQPTLTYQWRKNGSPLSNGGSISGRDDRHADDQPDGSRRLGDLRRRRHGRFRTRSSRRLPRA